MRLRRKITQQNHVTLLPDESWHSIFQYLKFNDYVKLINSNCSEDDKDVDTKFNKIIKHYQSISVIVMIIKAIII